MNGRAALRVTALEQRFGPRRALAGVSLALEEGERLAVLGPSGSGKTTLLRLIAGLDAPTAGEVEVAGRLASRAGHVLVAPEQRAAALVFQGLALFPHMDALGQVRYFAGPGREERARELFGRVGLEGRERARPHELSGGERQRLALARALAQEPRLLLLDEPFASLDGARREEMRSLLRGLVDRSRTTLVLVTHSREDALALATRLLVLEDGAAAAEGEVERLVAHPGRRAVVRALGLGEVVAGEGVGADEVATPLGRARCRLAGRSGAVSLLVRPEQARVLGEEELGGEPAEVLAVSLVAPEARTLRHSALVRVGSTTVRARASSPPPRPGARVRVALEGELEPLEG